MLGRPKGGLEAAWLLLDEDKKKRRRPSIGTPYLPAEKNKMCTKMGSSAIKIPCYNPLKGRGRVTTWPRSMMQPDLVRVTKKNDNTAKRSVSLW